VLSNFATWDPVFILRTAGSAIHLAAKSSSSLPRLFARYL
jgi:hypothetical protein